MSATPKHPIDPDQPGAHSLHRLVVLRVSEAFGASYAKSASAQPLIQEMKQALRNGKRVQLRRVAGYPLFAFEDQQQHNDKLSHSRPE
jgi:hypothetical protein